MNPSAEQIEAVRALARLSRLLERGTAAPTAGGTDGLSLAQYRVLAAVAGGDERASRMAARLRLGKPAISAAVDALCVRGLLTRAPVEGDQRAVALRVTAAGTRLLGTVEAATAARLDDVVSRTPDPAQVVRSLAWLGAALDEIADERLAERERAGRRP